MEYNKEWESICYIWIERGKRAGCVWGTNTRNGEREWYHMETTRGESVGRAMNVYPPNPSGGKRQ